MDLPAPTKAVRINRWLPYWAVLQMDVWQTARGWPFRLWVLALLVLGLGHLLHGAAVHHRAGLVQPASALVAEVLQGTLLAGTTLLILLTTGAVATERGPLADAVLSRGISRRAYFLAKWHARLTTLLGSYLLVAGLVVGLGAIMLHGDLAPGGSALALGVMAGVLGVVITLGVTVSAISRSTLLAAVGLWLTLYGLGLALAMFDVGLVNPTRLFRLLPALLRGEYDLQRQYWLLGWCAGLSAAIALVGMIHFHRRDV